MPKITDIKRAIQQLNEGSFQVLCDDLMVRKIGKSICSLGTHAGTEKTTKGTPDSYIKTDQGQYIFIEYTTQTSGLHGKIREDLEKCLDESKTGIRHSEIDRIVYCHTSSNITTVQDTDLNELCNAAGVRLELYGIDALAAEIATRYPTLAKDHLNVSLDTGQILSIDDYVSNNDSNIMMSPLGLEFHYRENELAQLSEAFQKTNLVVLTGNPGVGKTRIAIEFARRYASENDVNTYVIHDRLLPLYDDIQAYIPLDSPYFIVVDDANQITQLNHILELLKRENIKAIFTVRELLLSMPPGARYVSQRKKVFDFIENKKKYKVDVEIKEMMRQY